MPIAIRLTNAAYEIKNTYLEEVISPPIDPIGIVRITNPGYTDVFVYIDQMGNPITELPSTQFDNHPVWGNIEEVVLDGQVMIKIPKFYIKRWTLTNGTFQSKQAYSISSQPLSGYMVHRAFLYDAYTELDYILVGKYQASVNNSLLCSVPNVSPLTGVTFDTMKLYANNRNPEDTFPGYITWNMYHLGAIQWLYWIENTSMDSKAKTGSGNINTSGILNVNDPAVASATYRGIVGLWGNAWQYVDGMQIVKNEMQHPVIQYRVSIPIDNYQTTGDITIPETQGNFEYLNWLNESSQENIDFRHCTIAAHTTTLLSQAISPEGQRFDIVDPVYNFAIGGAYNTGAYAGLHCLRTITENETQLPCTTRLAWVSGF